MFSEYEKIKTESLIDEFLLNDKFEVKILIVPLKGRFDDKQKISLERIESFCLSKKVTYKKMYNPNTGAPIAIGNGVADIIFYQQPWGIHRCYSIEHLSKKALLCYIPYYVPNYGNLKLDCQKFHSRLFRFYVLNDAYGNEYKKYLSDLNSNIKVVGHPILDRYRSILLKNYSYTTDGGFVIYAPHWSIGKGTVNYSTFIWSGYTMLEFAEKHSNFRWVFRPHPRLFKELQNRGILSKVEIDNYIERWSRIAIIDCNLDYIETFSKSLCLITDCGSFLTEYFPTGKPVIRMVNDLANQPCDALKDIVNLYYNVYSSDELLTKLNELLILNIDLKKDTRTKASLDFYNCYVKDNYCASLVVQDIESLCISKC